MMTRRVRAFFSRCTLVAVILFLMHLDDSDANMMVTKPGISDKACAKSCLESVEIDCRYYKFHKAKLTCFLSAKNDSSISHMKKIDKPHTESGTNTANSWIGQLKSRVALLEKKQTSIKDLRKELAELRAEVAGLKNSRAMTHHLIRSHKELQDKNMEAINEKTDLIKSEAKRMEDAIMTLGELQKSFGRKITAINEDRKSTSLSMAMLGQSNKDIKSSIKELSSLSSQIEQSIANIRKEMMEVEVRFASLSTDVMDKSGSIEAMIGPEMKNMKDTQINLAQALSLITKKILRLTPKLPQMQRLISTNDGMVSAVTKQVQNFRTKIKQLNNRVVFTESELRKFLDPASKLNKDRRVVLAQMREEVAALTSSQRRLQNDVLTEISDRTRLYQELAAMKLLKKTFSNDVVSLRKQYKKMDKNMRNIILNGPQGDLISKILHRQVDVMKKMKLVKADQGDMRENLESFASKIAEVDKVIQAKKPKSNPLVWNNTENLLNIQKKLASMNWTLQEISTRKQNNTGIQKLQELLTNSLQSMNETQTELKRVIESYSQQDVMGKPMTAQKQNKSIIPVEGNGRNQSLPALNIREPVNAGAQNVKPHQDALAQYQRLHQYLIQLQGELAALQTGKSQGREEHSSVKG